MLSPKAKELIAKARIVSFASWQEQFAPELIAIFQAADDQSRYLTDADCQIIIEAKPELSQNVAIAQLLRDQASTIVSQARGNVLAAFPNITAEGGELYPPPRAEACWRDFWQFLRCVTYGIAGDRPDFTSATGLGFMEALYRELRVPLPAMVCGVKGLQEYSLNYLAQQQELDEQGIDINPSFEHLLDGLAAFSR